MFRYNYKIQIGTTEKCLWKREKCSFKYICINYNIYVHKINIKDKLTSRRKGGKGRSLRVDFKN